MDTLEIFGSLCITNGVISDGIESYHVDECDHLPTTAWVWALDLGADFSEADMAATRASTRMVWGLHMTDSQVEETRAIGERGESVFL